MKTKLNYKKINRTRRGRGYTNEYDLIKGLQEQGWKAKRLGGSSVNLPDVLATCDDTIYSIEAKAVMLPNTRYAYIPFDQIHRCVEMLDMFPVYSHRYLVFAFKFSKLHTVGFPKYYFFGFHRNNIAAMQQFHVLQSYLVRCDQFGAIKIISGTTEIPITAGVQTNKLPFFPTNLNGDFEK